MAILSDPTLGGSIDDTPDTTTDSPTTTDDGDSDTVSVTSIPGMYEDTSDDPVTKGSRENRQVTTAVVNDDPIPTGSTYVEQSTTGGDASIDTVAENTGGYTPTQDTTTTTTPTNETTGLPTPSLGGVDGIGGLVVVAGVILAVLASLAGGN